MNPDPTSRTQITSRLRKESDTELARLLRLYAAGTDANRLVQAEMRRRYQEKTTANHEAK